jgi:hypothetical protein
MGGKSITNTDYSNHKCIGEAAQNATTSALEGFISMRPAFTSMCRRGILGYLESPYGFLMTLSLGTLGFQPPEYQFLYLNQTMMLTAKPSQ